MTRWVAWLLSRLRATVWVHGVVRRSTNEGAVWDFLGAYTSPREAREACKGLNDFFFPARLDVAMDRRLKTLPGIEFPRRPEASAESAMGQPGVRR